MAIPRGIRNNNPLNIRKGNTWKGERPVSSDNSFEEFVSMEMGLRAAIILIRNYITGHNAAGRKFNTIESLISRWAPPSENSTQRYIEYVAKSAQMHPRQLIDFRNRETICAIVKAMAFVECGVQLDMSLIESAYFMI